MKFNHLKNYITITNWLSYNVKSDRSTEVSEMFFFNKIALYITNS